MMYLPLDKIMERQNSQQNNRSLNNTLQGLQNQGADLQSQLPQVPITRTNTGRQGRN